MITLTLPPWLWASGLLANCTTDEEATDKITVTGVVMQELIERGLAEIGRSDLNDFVPLDDLEGKAIAHKASMMAAHAVGLLAAPCLNCYVADIENTCPGINPMLSIQGQVIHGT